MLGTVLGTENKSVNKTHKNSYPHGFIFDNINIQNVFNSVLNQYTTNSILPLLRCKQAWLSNISLQILIPTIAFVT